MGYKKKRSKDSLIASSIITGLLLVSAYLMGRPDTTYGVRLALGESAQPPWPSTALNMRGVSVFATMTRSGQACSACLSLWCKIDSFCYAQHVILESVVTETVLCLLHMHDQNAMTAIPADMLNACAVTTASLAAYMGKGYYDKRKVFPQGVLAGISTVMTLGYIGSL